MITLTTPLTDVVPTSVAATAPVPIAVTSPVNEVIPPPPLMVAGVQLIPFHTADCPLIAVTPPRFGLVDTSELAAAVLNCRSSTAVLTGNTLKLEFVPEVCACGVVPSQPRPLYVPSVHTEIGTFTPIGMAPEAQRIFSSVPEP